MEGDWWGEWWQVLIRLLSLRVVVDMGEGVGWHAEDTVCVFLCLECPGLKGALRKALPPSLEVSLWALTLSGVVVLVPVLQQLPQSRIGTGLKSVSFLLAAAGFSSQ